MRRTLAASLIATLILVGAPNVAHARNGHPPCNGRRIRTIVPSLGAAEVTKRVRILIRCATARFPVEGGTPEATCYAKRESGLWPWAKSPTGSWGLFQVIPSTWQSWWHAYPLVRRWVRRATPNVGLQDRRLVAYANVMFSIRVLHDTEQPWSGGNYAC